MNILSIGCSHSVGPYNSNDRALRDANSIAKNMPYKDFPSKIYKELIKQNKKFKFRQVSIPGQGILSYLKVLEYYNSKDKLSQFDKLIIQHTHELRIPLYVGDDYINEEQFCEFFSEAFDLDNIPDSFYFVKSHGSCNMLSTQGFIPQTVHEKSVSKHTANTETLLYLLDYHENLVSYFSFNGYDRMIVNNALHRIKEICKINNIKLYDFQWDRSMTRKSKRTEIHTKASTTEDIRTSGFALCCVHLY